MTFAHRPPNRAVQVVAATASVVILLAGCSSPETAPPRPSESPGVGGGVNVVLRTPNWILPITTTGHAQGENDILRSALYPGLYSYTVEGVVHNAGESSKGNINERRSLAHYPEFSRDGKTITIELRDRVWSDGKPISSRDVELWWNLIKANKTEWADYRKGGFPDNVTSFKVIDAKKFSLTTDKAYSPGWFLGTQLNTMAPLPQHIWGKTAANAPVGDLDRKPEGAKKIFAFLTAASKDTAAYAKNPLWKVTSGPWTISSFNPRGETRLKPSARYEGEDRPKLSEVVFKPYPDDAAQFAVLQAGQLDYGYIPTPDLGQRAAIEAKGYTVSPWRGWSITYMAVNFANPKSGPIFKQKYVRQAMQYLIDQKNLSSTAWHGAATPTCGPVPRKPGDTDVESTCPYDYEPQKAVELLTEHGWKVAPNGTTTCEKAGKGDKNCGEGIAAGTPLSFTVVSQSGFSASTSMMTSLKGEFAKAGIQVNLKEVSDVAAASPKCSAGGGECPWDMSFFGAQGSWYFPPFPSGEKLFTADGSANLGGYSNGQADKLIAATQTVGDDESLRSYHDFIAEDLPVLWLPNPAAQVSAYKKNVHGIEPQDPLLGLHPQDWARS
ncbi:Oligopeptide-binding protein AppA [Austwickia sp. TVS 96-490-7B]|uniref:peptide ABC transporter substrate-binding protein n=1 Tax=Austwickia sp. TVS 96-490-7B TaxID=2830843 RepID=UPI001C563BCC|nr:peptide ABC transporter substrate-binding protein [Austwickia sp. TVS 96-490-7B]MBW3086511.1 Oligopeptide-binding protein AppA [Austwickia sp. TVS 96-490-7B]